MLQEQDASCPYAKTDVTILSYGRYIFQLLAIYTSFSYVDFT